MAGAVPVAVVAVDMASERGAACTSRDLLLR